MSFLHPATGRYIEHTRYNADWETPHQWKRYTVQYSLMGLQGLGLPELSLEKEREIFRSPGLYATEERPGIPKHDKWRRMTFMLNPDGCMLLGHSNSVVCIRHPDSNRSTFFTSGLCVCRCVCH